MPINAGDLTEQERSVFETLSPGQQQIYLDLEAPVRHLVGRWAPTDACMSAQVLAGACVPDRRVTAQAAIRLPIDLDQLSPDIRFRERVLPYRLKAARKGDLLVCPGGPSGLIGALLSALHPAQDYSHMGIVIEEQGFDGTVLRHCTTSEEWLNSKLFDTGKVFADTPLEIAIPEHGFRSDAVKFLWPGTITQTVEVAFKASKADLFRKDVYELDADGEPRQVKDDIGEPQNVLKEKFASLDAPNGPNDSRATGKAFLIHALSFDAATVPETKDRPAHLAEALIVQPCIQRATPRVRAALERIADATLDLRGHYRFFSYTNSRVAEKEDGPPTLETASRPFCRDGVLVTNPVKATRGMVCSTFIWEAVQLANQGAGPHISLDGRPARTETHFDEDPCRAILAQLNGRARIPAAPQDPADPQDGLYFYDAASRHDAAVALQAKLIAKVMDRVGTLLDDVAGPPFVGGLVGGAAGALISELIGTNPVLLAILLGVSTAYVDTQIQILRDTARHLSNQLGSTFQSDNSAQDNNSDDWQHTPGTGNTVSPDDTVNGWAAPYFESDAEVVGLYGSSQRVEVLSPTPVDGPTKFSTWEIAPDIASLVVRVFLIDGAGNQVFLSQANVHVGCAKMTTAALANMTQAQAFDPLPLGQYYAGASWQDTQGFQWRGPRVVVTVPGPPVDFRVFPPKETRRTVRISGTSDLLNRHATDEIPVIGTDPWVRNGVAFDSGWFPMGLDMGHADPGDDPAFTAWLKENYPNELDVQTQPTYVWQENIEKWGLARAKVDIKLLSTGEIVLTVTGGTQKTGDAIEFGDPLPPITIARKKLNSDAPQTFELKIERVGVGFPPVRATVHFQVDNNQQGG